LSAEYLLILLVMLTHWYYLDGYYAVQSHSSHQGRYQPKHRMRLHISD